MKNYLIITLGTRDVQLRKDLIEKSGVFEIQPHGKNALLFKNDITLNVFFNENFPDYYTVSPREGGEIIDSNPSIFEPYIEFPLIQDVLDQLISSQKIDHLLFVFTDQEQDWLAGKIKVRKNYTDDTLFFKEIIRKALKNNLDWHTVECDEYVVQTEVANIDYQYTHFKEAKSELFLIDPEEIGQIFLLPQGGIDQINHAITLQLLQAFKSKVKLFQKAEGNVPRQLQFTNYFLNDLNKQKILKHLEDYDFGLIDKSLHSDKKVYNLAQYAYNRLGLKNNQNKPYTDLLQKDGKYAFLNLDTSDQTKLKDLYLSAKISLKHREFNEFLWKVYTLNENLFTVKIEEKLGKTSKYFNPNYNNNDENIEWIDMLNRNSNELVQALRNQKIRLNNPNRKAFFALLPILFPNDLNISIYQRLAENLEIISKKRNELAHRLGSTDKNQINQLFGKSYSINELIADLDQIFEVKGYGLYDQIKKEIESLL